MQQNVQQTESEKLIDWILNKQFNQYCDVEDSFFELQYLNPAIKDDDADELKTYPKEYFHNQKIFQNLDYYLRNLLNDCQDLTISRKRFRAFLALIYLYGMREGRNLFVGCRDIQEIPVNKEPANLAIWIYQSEVFNKKFLEVDRLLQQKDTLAVEALKSIEEFFSSK